MKISELPKIKLKSAKRVGRGIGSGKGGHTVGRGAKGQKVREKVSFIFEGTKIKKSLLKRLPLLRGKGRFGPNARKPLAVNLKYLNVFSPNEEVTLETLGKKGIIEIGDGVPPKVKILGEGNINIPLLVKLPCSKGAKIKIEKAGGKVLVEGEKLPKKEKVSKNKKDKS